MHDVNVPDIDFVRDKCGCSSLSLEGFLRISLQYIFDISWCCVIMVRREISELALEIFCGNLSPYRSQPF